jgi:hypothetical protein
MRVAPRDAAAEGTGATGAIDGHLDYPATWSQRAGVVRDDRHLGTIDAVVLACRATEVISSGIGVLKTVDVAASTSPTTQLDIVPIEIADVEGQRFRFLVGGIRVTVGTDARREPRPLDGLPAWMTAWHTASTALVRLEDVEVDREAGSGRATARVVAREESPWRIDAHAPDVSAADAIAAAGAITEAAIFEQAGVRRDAVGNFWMRRAQIEFDRSTARHATARLSVDTVHSHVFERGSSRWHSSRVRVESELGFRIRADVAFEEHPRPDQPGVSAK